MQTKVMPLAALAATLACGAVLAQTSPPTSPSPGSTTDSISSDTKSSGLAGVEYTKIDKDKDGTLSKKEAAANKELTKQWVTLDVNKDGKLDEAEFAQFESESMSMDNDDGLKKDNKPKY